MANVKVRDSEFLQYEKYDEIANRIESALSQYCNVLDQIYSNRLIEGKFAENIADYCGTVRYCLSGYASEIVSGISRQMKSFVKEVDEADKDIY